MWALLSDPAHATDFGRLGEEYAPLRNLAERLAHRDYASQVFAFKAGNSFNLTTAPNDCRAAWHDGIGIEYIPERSSFAVGYSESSLAARRQRIRSFGSQDCRPEEIEELIDEHVQKLLQFRPESPAEPTRFEKAVLLALFGGMFLYLIFWLLLWFDIPVDRPMLASMGMVGMAMSLYTIRESLLPLSKRPMWRRSWRRPTSVRMGRLVLLSVGIAFGAGGVVFLRAAILGFGELPKYGLWLFLGVFAIAVALLLIGLKLDRRRLEAAFAEYDAKQPRSG